MLESLLGAIMAFQGALLAAVAALYRDQRRAVQAEAECQTKLTALLSEQQRQGAAQEARHATNVEALTAIRRAVDPAGPAS